MYEFLLQITHCFVQISPLLIKINIIDQSLYVYVQIHIIDMSFDAIHVSPA